MGQKLYYCQWPKCSYLCAMSIRRGESMTNMFLCRTHGELFHELTNAGAMAISDRRQPLRWLHTSTGI